MTIYEVTCVMYARMKMPERKTTQHDSLVDALDKLTELSIQAAEDSGINHVEFRQVRLRPQ